MQDQALNTEPMTGAVAISTASPARTRLWLASPHFYPTYGGAQNRYRQYIPGLLERGLEVQLFTGTPLLEERSNDETEMAWYGLQPGQSQPTSRLDGVPLERIRLPDRKGRERTEIYYDALVELCTRPAAGPVVTQLLTNLRPEARPWIERLNRAGVATLYSVSQFPAWPSKPTKRWFRGAGYRQVYDAFDALVTNSPAIEEFLWEIGVTTRVEYIPNGVNLDRFQPAHSPELQRERDALRARLGIAESDLVLATVGAIMPRKGPDFALEAWRQLLQAHPDTHILLIGPRADQYDARLEGFSRRIEELVQSSGAPQQVHFSGQVDDVERWLRAADVFMLPTEREGTPNSVLEAMATGLPVIVTPYTGLSQAIGTPGRQYRLVERSANALAAVVAGLLQHAEQRRHWGEAGLRYIREYMDQQRSLDHYAALYHELGERAERRSARGPGAVPQANLAPVARPARNNKPDLLVLGAPPRGGNHLLRGLLDDHPQLLLPPDEDYFIRHLARHPLLRLRGLLVSRSGAPGFYRRLQKDGHLERVNAGHGTEVFGSEDSLDLGAYYGFLRRHHKRLSPDNLVRNHVEALAVALGHRPGDGRLRVCFCAMQPSNLDLSKVSAMLSRSYSIRGIFLVRRAPPWRPSWYAIRRWISAGFACGRIATGRRLRILRRSTARHCDCALKIWCWIHPAPWPECVSSPVSSSTHACWSTHRAET